nr:hypothetical protein [Tanacetum cinerariifolium]
MNELCMDIDDQIIIASSFIYLILKDTSMSLTSVQSLEHEVSVAIDGVADTWPKLLLYIYVMFVSSEPSVFGRLKGMLSLLLPMFWVLYL